MILVKHIFLLVQIKSLLSKIKVTILTQTASKSSNYFNISQSKCLFVSIYQGVYLQKSTQMEAVYFLKTTFYSN